MKNRICTIGNLTVDDIILYDEHQMYLETIGGDALYAAIGTRVWGAQPTMIARIGRSFPETAIKDLDQVGINTYLVKVDKNDIRNWALYEPGGARQFINHLSSGKNQDVSITGSELPEVDLLSADAYHVAPMPTDAQASVITRLAELPGQLSWDPHVDYLRQPNFNKMAYETLAKVDIFLPSKEEVVAMYGSDDITAAAKHFASVGPGVVAIKMSREGSLLYVRDRNQMYHVPIYPARNVDPTGAGDSYCGGFVTGYLATGDPLHAACCGTVSASFVVEHTGALNTFQADFSTAEKRLEIVKNNIKLI